MTSETSGEERSVRRSANSRQAAEALKAGEISSRDRANLLREEQRARRNIAVVLVYGYIGITLLSILAPVLIVKLVGGAEIAAVKSTTEGMAPITSGLVGVLGFVLGYYFKSEEKGGS